MKIGALAGAVGGGVYSAVRQYEAAKDHPTKEFDVAEVIWDTAKGERSEQPPEPSRTCWNPPGVAKPPRVFP